MHVVELANIIRDFYFHCCYSRVEKYSRHFSFKETHFYKQLYYVESYL